MLRYLLSTTTTETTTTTTATTTTRVEGFKGNGKYLIRTRSYEALTIPHHRSFLEKGLPRGTLGLLSRGIGHAPPRLWSRTRGLVQEHMFRARHRVRQLRSASCSAPVHGPGTHAS